MLNCGMRNKEAQKSLKLETERLIIRELSTDDLGAVHRYASDPIVTKYMIWGHQYEG